MKVMTVLGTRPEIIRLSQVIPKLDKACEHILVHTGQHYDFTLSDVFFQNLKVRKPDYFLDNFASLTFGHQVSKILFAVEKNLQKVMPERLLVLGDTNSGLAAFVAKRMGIPVYHMEAGNRCYDDRVPEEVNRRVIDHCSDMLMPYTERSRANLLREGIAGERILVTGNPIFEILQSNHSESSILPEFDIKSGEYFLVTAHRQENVDDRERLGNIIHACSLLIEKYNLPVIFSRHPRTEDNMKRWDIGSDVVTFHEPFGFDDFLELERNALCILTDSGTVQEECCILKKRCVTLRDVTERPETIECGSNILSGVEPDSVLRCVRLVLEEDTGWLPPPEYVVPDVSDKVVRILTGV